MKQTRRDRRLYGLSSGHSGRLKSCRIVCAGFGKEVLVQAPPPKGKKLFCMECLKK